MRLEIGQLARVELEAMRFAFDVVMRGSLAGTARGSRSSRTEGSAWCPHWRQNGGARAARRRLPPMRGLRAAGHRRRPHAGDGDGDRMNPAQRPETDHVHDLRLRQR